MIDQIICLIAGAFIGSFITMVAIALAFASRKADDDCRTPRFWKCTTFSFEDMKK